MHVALALAFVAFVGVGLPDGMLGVAWPSLRSDLERPLEDLGELILFWSAGYLLSSVVSGPLLARFGFGPVLVASALAMGLGAGGYAIASDWTALLAASAIGGAGGGTIDAGLNTWLAMRRGAGSLNVLHGCYGLGAALGPASISAGLALGSWRIAYAVVAGMFLLIGLSLAATRSVWGTEGGTRPGDGSLSRALRLPGAWAGIALFFLYVGVEVSAAQWSYSLLVESRGVAASTGVAAVSLFWIVFTGGRFFFGAIAGSRSLRPLLLGSLVVSGAGALLLSLSTSGPASAVALGLIGFGLAPAYPLLVAATPGRVGAHLAPSTIGLQVAGGTIGGALVPAALGLAASRVGLEAIPVALFAGIAILLAASAALDIDRSRV
jgi:fucose permease